MANARMASCQPYALANEDSGFDIFAMQGDEAVFHNNVLGNIIGPSFPQVRGLSSLSGLSNLPDDFNQWSYPLNNSFSEDSDFFSSAQTDIHPDLGLWGSYPQIDWGHNLLGGPSNGGSISSRPAATNCASASAAPLGFGPRHDTDATLLDTNQEASLSEFCTYIRLESEKPWRHPEMEHQRMIEINNSVTLFCDLMDSILTKYRMAQYQHEATPGRNGANITVMMVFVLIPRVLKIYRSFCQMFIDSSTTSSVDEKNLSQFAEHRPSPKRKASHQVLRVSQLAVVDYHLQHLSRFFHASEFVEFVQPAIIESGTRCIQDLQNTIRVTVAKARTD